MAFVLKDRVKETTTTTGTGTITLAGASTGFQGFSAIGNANQTYYTISGGSEWEVGIGTYTSAGTTLSRDTVLSSSNSGSLVNFSAGTKDVFVVYPASQGTPQDLSYTTIATAAGTTVLTNASTYYLIFTGTSTQTVTLPVTSTIATGWSYHIVNNSTGNITVNSSGGNLVITVLPGTTAMATCIGTTLTTAADWEAGYTDFSTATGTGSVVLGTSPTVSGPTINAGYIEQVYAVVDAAGVAISPTNGSLQTWTLGASRTPTAGTWTAGASLTLHIDDGTAYTITWTDSSFGTGGVKWVGGTAPTLATSGYTVIELWKIGTQVYGALVGTVV